MPAVCRLRRPHPPPRAVARVGEGAGVGGGSGAATPNVVADGAIGAAGMRREMGADTAAAEVAAAGNGGDRSGLWSPLTCTGGGSGSGVAFRGVFGVWRAPFGEGGGDGDSERSGAGWETDDANVWAAARGVIGCGAKDNLLPSTLWSAEAMGLDGSGGPRSCGERARGQPRGTEGETLK